MIKFGPLVDAEVVYLYTVGVSTIDITNELIWPIAQESQPFVNGVGKLVSRGRYDVNKVAEF